MTTRERNRRLAQAIRDVVKAEGLDARLYQPNGDLWARAKRVLAKGAPVEVAAWHAVHAQSQATVDRIAPVAQVPTPTRKKNARRNVPEAFRAQQERVRKGEVLRDSKGRIVSRDVQEAVEALLANA